MQIIEGSYIEFWIPRNCKEYPASDGERAPGKERLCCSFRSKDQKKNTSANKYELTELLLSYESRSNPISELLPRRRRTDQSANEGFALENFELLADLTGSLL